MRRTLAFGLGTLAGLVSLALAMAAHSAGQPMLATALLALAAAALWVYGFSSSLALRYVFPAVAAALVFVVFPMLYTVGMGFTNQSSQNLLSQAQAREALLAERVPTPGSQRPFHLLDEGGALRLWLPPLPGQAQGLLSAPWQGNAGELQATAAPVPATLLPLFDVVRHTQALRGLSVLTPQGQRLQLLSLRELAEMNPVFTPREGGALQDQLTGTLYQPDARSGFFTAASGERAQPGFLVGVGLAHYLRIFTEPKFSQPFVSVFLWTCAFAGLSVLGAAALGLLLACLLEWEALRGKAFYRLVLFLPYAVPGFLSILVFKGLFNQNLGEVNLILHALFGIKPAWFSDPWLARAMLLMVNVWLGFPYMMVLSAGLLKSIPADLHEASAMLGAGPVQHFMRVTLPLIARPMAPLLISAFAFNFNNFVLVSLLTNGRPDQADAALPAGTTDLLVTYTWRIAFQDSGQQFGLAAALSTVIFLLVAAVTLLQLRLSKANATEAKH